MTLGPADTTDTGGLFGTPSYFARAGSRAAGDRGDRRVRRWGSCSTRCSRDAGPSREKTFWPRSTACVPPIRELASDVPAPFDAILRQALDPDPTRRTITMAEFARD